MHKQRLLHAAESHLRRNSAVRLSTSAATMSAVKMTTFASTIGCAVRSIKCVGISVVLPGSIASTALAPLVQETWSRAAQPCRTAWWCRFAVRPGQTAASAYVARTRPGMNAPAATHRGLAERSIEADYSDLFSNCNPNLEGHPLTEAR